MDTLDIFAIVVEQQSLNKAGHILNISQPALSRKISNLENELGVALFERRGKRLVLTRAGQKCYEHALRSRNLRRKFLEELHSLTAKGTPTSLTIGASLTTLQSTFPDLLTLYLEEYPDTDIKAVTGKTHEIVSLVKEHKVDLGLVASRVDHPNVFCIPLFDDHLCLVLPQDHSYTDKSFIEIGDLGHLPMILFSKGTWYRILMDELFHRYSVFPDVKMEIDSFEAIVRLVSTCKAATLLPKSYLRSNLLGDNGLVVRSIPELEGAKRTTSLIYIEAAWQHTAIRQFITKAKSTYPIRNLESETGIRGDHP